MSRAFVKDGDQEEIPAVPQRAFIPQGATNFVTVEGLEALRAERAGLLAEIEAASGGEDDVRVRRSWLAARLALLDSRIASAVVPQWLTRAAATAAAAPAEARFGSYVTMRLSSQAPQTVRIVGADEADAAKGLVSVFSPIACAICGHREGDRFSTGLSGAAGTIEIISISETPVPLTCSNNEKTAAAGGPRKNIMADIDAAIREAKEAQNANPREAASSATIDADLSPDERLPLVNERGIGVGHAPNWQCHDGSHLMHPAIVINLPEGPVHAHVRFGEKPDAAAARLLSQLCPEAAPLLMPAGRKVVRSKTETELVYEYKA